MRNRLLMCLTLVTGSTLGTTAAGAAPSPPAARPSVAVLRLEAVGVPASTAAVVSDEVVRAVREHNVFSTVRTPTELDLLLGPAQQEQLRACANDACALVDAEFAGMLGVTHLLTGRVARLGDALLLQLRLLELRSALEVSQGSQRLAGNNEAGLLDAAGAVTSMVLAKMSDAKAAPRQPEAAAKPQAPPPAANRWVKTASGLAALGGGAAVGLLGLLGAALGVLAYVVPYYLAPISTPGLPGAGRFFVFLVPTVGLLALGAVGIFGGLALTGSGALLLVWGLS